MTEFLLKEERDNLIRLSHQIDGLQKHLSAPTVADIKSCIAKKLSDISDKLGDRMPVKTNENESGQRWI